MRSMFTPLPHDQWPPKDRLMWLEAQKPQRLFEPVRPASKWRPATIANTQHYYGMFLSWLQTQGALDPALRPIDRATEAWVRAFFDAYSVGRAEHSAALAIRGIAFVVRATEPPDGLPWLSKLASRLTNTATPSRSKVSRTASLTDLIKLGEDLMGAGRRALDKRPVSGAVSFRDGLMIAALGTRPIRRANLAGLRIGHSIIRDTQGFHVRFQDVETKAGREIEFYYPSWLTPAFDFYIASARPVLLGSRDTDGEDHLWIGRQMKAIIAADITHRMIILTRRHLGRVISPHMFRDCAATDIAIFDPEHIGIVKTVLSHASHVTGEKHYNLATMLTASSRHQDVIARLRKGGNKK